MRTLTLPAVAPRATLVEVLGVMARADVCAVVVDPGGAERMVDLDALTARINAVVDGGADPAEVTVESVASSRRNAVPPAGEAAHHAVLGHGAGMAEVAASSDAYAAQLGGIFTLWKCAGPVRVHTFSTDPGPLCPMLHPAPQPAVTATTLGTYP